MLYGFFNHMREVIAFGAKTIVVRPFVVVLFDGPVEEVARFLDLIANFWEINEAKRGAVFIDQMLQGNAVKSEVIVF